MKTLEEKIEVMQAALDGKEIERYIGGDIGWYALSNSKEVDYDWTNQDYRVKPEPLEFYVSLVEGTSAPCIVNKSYDCLVDIQNGSGNHGRIIKMREVIDE